MELFGLAILVMYCDVKIPSECASEIIVLADDRKIKQEECDDTIELVRELMKKMKDDRFIKNYECAEKNAAIIMSDTLKVTKTPPTEEKI